jgi:tetratricopeptide (TPR) repeat protein
MVILVLLYQTYSLMVMTIYTIQFTPSDSQAIERLQPTTAYEPAAEFWPQYLRGQAYLKLGRGAEAAEEFQKILDHRGQSPLSVLYPLASARLARLGRIGGDQSRSRKGYEDLLVIWRDADQDLPALIELKKEYQRLR